MPALKPVAGFGMIKIPNGNAPMDKIKAPSIVIHMAFGAVPFAPVRSDQGGVQACPGCKALADVAMTCKTSKFRWTLPCVVAIRAVAWTVQSAMRTGKLSGRYLGMRCRCRQQQQQGYQDYVRHRSQLPF